MTAATTAEITEKKILIVEDQGLIAMDLKRRLESCGYSVIGIASTADDALRLAVSSTPDVILMDIQLKGRKDGIEASAEVRGKLDIPVVFVTAHADRLTLDRAMQTGPFGYVIKPFGASELRTQVEMACFKHLKERELRASRALLATTLGSIGEAVIATDAAGRTEFLNSTAATFAGLPLANAVGKPVADLFPLLDAESGEPARHPVLTLLDSKAAAPLHGEYRLPSADGSSRLVNAVVTANTNEDGLLGAVLTLRDITSQRDMEMQVRQSQNLAAISVMAGALAHDFNNLLTVILGYADIAKTDPLRAGKALDQIQKAGESAAAVCRQLLDVSNHDIVKTEVVDLNGIVSENSNPLAQLLGPHSTLRMQLSSQPLLVTSEHTQLQRVLMNLAINARDAMPDGGALTITTRRDESGWAELLVSDTGVGMSAATLRRVFEPFFSSRGARGTGLGMTIVHSIVTKWSGKIRVESAPGHGTTFRITFPPVAAPAPAPAAAAGREGVILLIAADADVRDLLSRALERADFAVIEAATGEDGLLRLSGGGANVDLIVSDVALPFLREKFPRARVLFMSSRARGQQEGNEMLASADAELLSSPVNPAFLVARARDIVASSRRQSTG